MVLNFSLLGSGLVRYGIAATLQRRLGYFCCISFLNSCALKVDVLGLVRNVVLITLIESGLRPLHSDLLFQGVLRDICRQLPARKCLTLPSIGSLMPALAFSGTQVPIDE